MRSNTIRRSIFLTLAFIAGNAARSNAETIVMAVASGTVPNTATTYNVTSTGTLRSNFPAGSSDNGVFNWTTPFNEFLATGAETTTITFSSAVTVSEVTAGVESIVNGTGNFFTLSVAGGTATTADFTLTDSLDNVLGDGGAATYNPTTGAFGPGNGNNTGIMIGGTSLDTLTSLTIAGNDGGNGWTSFYGLNSASPAAVPEPSSLAMCGLAGLIGSAYAWRRRRLRLA